VSGNLADQLLADGDAEILEVPGRDSEGPRPADDVVAKKDVEPRRLV